MGNKMKKLLFTLTLSLVASLLHAGIGFSNLTSNQSVNYRTSNLTLSGTLGGFYVVLTTGYWWYPNQGDKIAITIDGNTQTTTINDQTGDFSVNYNPASIPASPTPYTITYSYPGNTYNSFPSTSDNSTTLIVNALPVVVNGSRNYDGTTTAQASILNVANNLDGTNLTLSGSVTLSSANVGASSIISFSGLTLGGSAAGNYTLTGASGSVNIAVVPPIVGLNLLAGNPQLSLSGILSSNFTVQYSTNLAGTNWIDLRSITNLAANPFQFTDPDGFVPPARYYRAVMK
jgi:YDG domain